LTRPLPNGVVHAAVAHPHSIDPFSAVLLVLNGLVGATPIALLLRRRRR
jgi:hypothetical protein